MIDNIGKKIIQKFFLSKIMDIIKSFSIKYNTNIIIVVITTWSFETMVQYIIIEKHMPDHVLKVDEGVVDGHNLNALF